jgi:hypothetical protein
MPAFSRHAAALAATAGMLAFGTASAIARTQWRHCSDYTFDKFGDGVFHPETVGITCKAAKPIELGVVHKADRGYRPGHALKYRGWTCRSFSIMGPGNGWNCTAAHGRRLRYDVEGP